MHSSFIPKKVFFSLAHPAALVSKHWSYHQFLMSFEMQSYLENQRKFQHKNKQNKPARLTLSEPELAKA